MEKEQMNDATGSRRLLPPVYPRSPNATNLTRAGSSSPQYYSRLQPFLHNPAAATHFSSQAGPGYQAYQVPSSPLSLTPHASAGGTGASAGGSSNTISQIAVSGPRFTAGSSSYSYQEPPSLLPQTHASGGFSGGGVLDGGSFAWDASQVSLPGSSCYQIPPTSSLAPMDPVPMLGYGVDGCGSSSNNTILGQSQTTFLSPFNTGQTSQVGLAPCSSVDLHAPSSSSPLSLVTQTMASVDFGSTEEFDLEALNGDFGSTMASVDFGWAEEPLPPSLNGLALPQAGMGEDLEALLTDPVYIPLVDVDDLDDYGNNVVPFVDLVGPDEGLNFSGHGMGTSTQAPSPSLASLAMSLASADAYVKKEVMEWSSWATSQMGNNTIAGGSSYPYSSANTGNGITQAPWTPALQTSTGSIPPCAAKFEVKEEAEDRSWHVSTQLGKNTITSGGSSSSKGLMVFETKPNILPSLGTGLGSGAAGSSRRGRGRPRGNTSKYKDNTNSPFVEGFANGKFTQEDITTIMADKGLQKILLENPKKVRSMLSNRRSAHNSMVRKKAYVSDLERKAEQLEQQKKVLSAKVHTLESTNISLRAEKDEIEIKLHGFERRTQLMDDMNDALNAVLRRLQISVRENMGSDVSRTSYQEMSPQMTQQGQLQVQNHQSAQSQEDEDELTRFEKFCMAEEKRSST
ncbi:hypothetical protein QYE76_004510 [Lolium multiflorum]|uniref:BZIP domain-containing protein n=1 Tax=Lolium multiflorum TaxID=4521 RepID=A0AAD8RRY5_LOLMU|nr:hypothetical protein QYE76_004399 [Lolium multiflorum]KAK1630085.1 hypothetical protein QYE76_004400 [Lolium multiflorum]KAK1630195.1 hypothetical protein QYE76_004510 [Lolium multiflorum]